MGDDDPADENEDGEIIEVPPASYMKQNLLSLFDNGKIGMPEGMADGAVTASIKNGGLKFKPYGGTVRHLPFSAEGQARLSSGNTVDESALTVWRTEI